MTDPAIHLITDERCLAYEAPGHPERPARVRGIVETLRQQREVPARWLAPRTVHEESLLRAVYPQYDQYRSHTGRFLPFL